MRRYDATTTSGTFRQSVAHAFALKQLRLRPTWRLLSAENAPTVTALLRAHLPEGTSKRPTSLLVERLLR